LISSKKILARKNNSGWLQHSNATWRRKHWTKSLWEYTHQGKWWVTLYMVSFHRTVQFLMPSWWNWNTMWNNFWLK
jgi:hypothetical protein